MHTILKYAVVGGVLGGLIGLWMYPPMSKECWIVAGGGAVLGAGVGYYSM